MSLIRHAEPNHFKNRGRPVDHDPWDSCILKSTLSLGEDERHRFVIPAYTTSLVTTSTSYLTRGFLIWENTSFSSVRDVPSYCGGGSGDERGILKSSSIMVELGLPVPIMCSYWSSLDGFRDNTGPPLNRPFSSTGESRLLPDRLSRRRFSRYARVS